MAKFPFIPTLDEHEDPAPSADIFEFPRDVTLRAKLRGAERQVERLEQQVADNDPRSPDYQERLRATVAVTALEIWREDLKQAEDAVAMLDADDTLTFRGELYRAHRSFHGAN